MGFSKFITTQSTYQINHVNYFKDSLESIPDYEKIVLIAFLIENDVDLLNEGGFLKSDINRLCLEFKTISKAQNDENLVSIKNEECANVEKA